MLLQQVNQEPVCLLGSHFKLIPVQAQKYICGKESDPFVPIDEGMIHDQRLKQGGRHLGEIGVVAGLGTIQRAFQEPGVADARGAAKPLQQDTVNFQCLVAAEKDNRVTRQAVFPALRFRRWIAPGASRPRGVHDVA